jgi:hypothetical protein
MLVHVSQQPPLGRGLQLLDDFGLGAASAAAAGNSGGAGDARRHALAMAMAAAEPEADANSVNAFTPAVELLAGQQCASFIPNCIAMPAPSVLWSTRRARSCAIMAGATMLCGKLKRFLPPWQRRRQSQVRYTAAVQRPARCLATCLLSVDVINSGCALHKRPARVCHGLLSETVPSAWRQPAASNATVKPSQGDIDCQICNVHVGNIQYCAAAGRQPAQQPIRLALRPASAAPAPHVHGLAADIFTLGACAPPCA